MTPSKGNTKLNRFIGLNAQEVLVSRKKYGNNQYGYPN